MSLVHKVADNWIKKANEEQLLASCKAVQEDFNRTGKLNWELMERVKGLVARFNIPSPMFFRVGDSEFHDKFHDTLFDSILSQWDTSPGTLDWEESAEVKYLVPKYGKREVEAWEDRLAGLDLKVSSVAEVDFVVAYPLDLPSFTETDYNAEDEEEAFLEEERAAEERSQEAADKNVAGLKDSFPVPANWVKLMRTDYKGDSDSFGGYSEDGWWAQTVRVSWVSEIQMSEEDIEEVVIQRYKANF